MEHGSLFREKLWIERERERELYSKKIITNGFMIVESVTRTIHIFACISSMYIYS